MKEITQNTSLRWNGRRRSGGFGPGAIQTSQVSKKIGSKVTKSDVSDFRLVMLLVFVVFGCIFIVDIFRSTVASCPLHWNIYTWNLIFVAFGVQVVNKLKHR